MVITAERIEVDCRNIDPEIVLTVRFYQIPAGFCWYPVRDGLEGDDVGSK